MENNIFDDNQNYIPPSNFRSILGKIVWNTFASDDLAGWKSGEIIRPMSLADQEPYYPNIDNGTAMAAGDWVANLIKALDEALPEVNRLIDSLEYDSLTIRETAPALGMPASPSTVAAAECLVAARVLVACIDEVIPPMMSTNKEVSSWLDTVSRLAVMLGGEEAFLHAMTIVTDPETFCIVQASDELLQFGGEDQNG